MHSPLHPLLGHEASRAALVCQTLPPPSPMKAVNKLSIQGVTQWDGGVITWKVFLNCKKSSGNVTNISWYHLFNSLFPKDLGCLHTFWNPLMLSCFTHSLPSDIQSTAHCCSNCAFPDTVSLWVPVTPDCFSALLGDESSQGEGKEAGQKQLYKQLPWLRTVKWQGQERPGTEMPGQGLHEGYHHCGNLLPLLALLLSCTLSIYFSGAFSSIVRLLVKMLYSVSEYAFSVF